MLKITQIPSKNRSVTLRLEGRLIGPWVDELRQLCEPLLADRTELTLHLSEVSFADENGVTLLASLNRRRVTLFRPSPFVAVQLEASAGSAS